MANKKFTKPKNAKFTKTKNGSERPRTAIVLSSEDKRTKKNLGQTVLEREDQEPEKKRMS